MFGAGVNDSEISGFGTQSWVIFHFSVEVLSFPAQQSNLIRPLSCSNDVNHYHDDSHTSSSQTPLPSQGLIYHHTGDDWGRGLGMWNFKGLWKSDPFLASYMWNPKHSTTHEHFGYYYIPWRFRLEPGLWKVSNYPIYDFKFHHIPHSSDTWALLSVLATSNWHQTTEEEEM